MKKLYVVTREGIYRHEIVGIYDTKTKAKNRAISVCKAEQDDYHRFYIMVCKYNEPIEDGDLIIVVKKDKHDFYYDDGVERISLV